ncbi:MAG: alpha/beta hydrolase, partial [Chloroflexia bacterium]
EVFTEEDRAAYREAWSQPGAINGLLNYYRASASPTEAPGLPPVLVSTLVIWGEADTAMLASNLNGLEDVVPDLKVERIPQGTHWVVHEEGEQITNAIRTFIGPADIQATQA